MTRCNVMVRAVSCGAYMGQLFALLTYDVFEILLYQDIQSGPVQSVRQTCENTERQQS